MPRAIVLGGTGLLGAQAIRALVEDGYTVTSVARRSPALDSWHPAEVTHLQADVGAMDGSALDDLLAGNQVVVQAFGPDDRVVPPAPADRFFQQGLVDVTEEVCGASARVGVRSLVVFGSYFTYLNRTFPDLGLAERHRYIAARVRQLAGCEAAAGPDLSVAVLEIPYVFGTMPERDPMWFDVLVRRIHWMRPWIFFPRGGTAVCSARFVGEVAAAVVRSGLRGPVPVAEENITWGELLRLATEELYGTSRRVVTIPTPVAAAYGWVEQLLARLRRREPGLHYGRYIGDVHARRSYIEDVDRDAVLAKLGLAPSSVEPAIRDTFSRCAELLA